MYENRATMHFVKNLKGFLEVGVQQMEANGRRKMCRPCRGYDNTIMVGMKDEL
jgi:hypothetical protein